MAHYLIGDVQGCGGPFAQLLSKIGFSPSRDTIWLLGDLVNRGPDNVAVLHRLMAYGASARCLLGNHDLHLLAVALGVRKAHRSDTVQDILSAPDRDAMLDWLRLQPLAMLETLEGLDFLMFHAGVLPQWSAAQTQALADELHKALAEPPSWQGLEDFMRHLFGNEPFAWQDDLQGDDRLRVVVNALTRLRFCTPEGVMEFTAKEGLDTAPSGYIPWFDAPNHKALKPGVTAAFGHWSTLGLDDPQGLFHRPGLYCMDTGCVWGQTLSALRISHDGAHELIQVPGVPK